MQTPQPEIRAGLCPRKTQVTAWDAFAQQESERLRGRRLHLYVDNRGAECSLRKGSSRADDINTFVLAVWLRCFEFDVELTVFRVPSKENAADAPSRGVPPVRAVGPLVEDSFDFYWAGGLADVGAKSESQQ